MLFFLKRERWVDVAHFKNTRDQVWCSGNLGDNKKWLEKFEQVSGCEMIVVMLGAGFGLEDFQ